VLIVNRIDPPCANKFDPPSRAKIMVTSSSYLFVFLIWSLLNSANMGVKSFFCPWKAPVFLG